MNAAGGGPATGGKVGPPGGGNTAPGNGCGGGCCHPGAPGTRKTTMNISETGMSVSVTFFPLSMLAAIASLQPCCLPFPMPFPKNM